MTNWFLKKHAENCVDFNNKTHNFCSLKTTNKTLIFTAINALK